MAHNIYFGSITKDNRYMTKDWTQGTPVSCDIYTPTDRINPVLIVDTSKVNLENTNYCEIPDFGRQYFITSIVPQAGKLVHVMCHVDVLGTYDAEIRNCNCIAERSTSTYNTFLQDNARLFNTYTWNQYISLEDVGSPSILLISTV